MNSRTAGELVGLAPLWEPSAEFKQSSALAQYMAWLAETSGRTFSTYGELWEWSVTDLDGFWASIADYFGAAFSKPYTSVLERRAMPGAVWFKDAQVNYAENVFRHATDRRPALIFESESQPAGELSWSDLRAQVADLAGSLRERGVVAGDRVVGYLPNIPETVVAFLACASLGVIWSNCAPDFGTGAVLDRFAQIQPKVLITVGG